MLFLRQTCFIWISVFPDKLTQTLQEALLVLPKPLNDRIECLRITGHCFRTSHAQTQCGNKSRNQGVKLVGFWFPLLRNSCGLERQNVRLSRWLPYLVLTPLKLELATEYRLDRPLSLAELVSTGEVCVGESGPRSSLTAESGLSGSGSELLILTLALFLAALFRNERREFSIWKQNTANHKRGVTDYLLCLNTAVFLTIRLRVPFVSVLLYGMD